MLVLDTASASFTPFSVAGTDDPYDRVYVMNKAGQLIDALDEGPTLQISATVTDTPPEPDGKTAA